MYQLLTFMYQLLTFMYQPLTFMYQLLTLMYQLWTTPQANPEHCQALCCAVKGCSGFTLAHQGAPGSANCWLKNGATTLGPSSACAASGKLNCTSGLVSGGGHR